MSEREAPTVGLRRGPVLCLAGDGHRAAVFHLGALTRLNELGLLAGTETIYGVAGGSILGAMLAVRVPWPLHGAFRDWPEAIAEPTREICCRHAPGRSLRRGSFVASTGVAGEEERFARELLGPAEDGRRDGIRIVFGASGLTLGEGAIPEENGGELRWALGRRPPSLDPEPEALTAAIGSIPGDLTPLSAMELALLENRGYLFADAALRARGRARASIEPLPPQPPHPRWANEERLRRRSGRGGGLRWPRLRRAGPRRTEDALQLLRRHRPFLQQDSLEAYPPDPVETIAELSIGRRCNTLHRADGRLIASVNPVAGSGRLDLDYLDDARYADGQPVAEGDYLDETGGSHAADALAMRQRRGFEPVVYGRGQRSGGRLWLQYWLFHYYNDKGFLKAGRHEGDWEVVQLRVGSDGNPDAVTYGRHAGGERADWQDVERLRTDEGEAPVVYCARGSHAALLGAGTYPGPAVPDHNDGLGPRLRPRLIVLGEGLPGWARWPGRWGATRRREAFEGDSPQGPAHDWRWREPAAFHLEARPAAEAPAWTAPPPPTPRFEARLEGDHAVLEYRFPDRRSGEAAPARIVAAAVGDGLEVSAVDCFLVDGGAGSCALPLTPGAEVSGVRTAVTSELGTPGLTLTVPLRGTLL